MRPSRAAAAAVLAAELLPTQDGPVHHLARTGEVRQHASSALLELVQRCQRSRYVDEQHAAPVIGELWEAVERAGPGGTLW